MSSLWIVGGSTIVVAALISPSQAQDVRVETVDFCEGVIDFRIERFSETTESIFEQIAESSVKVKVRNLRIHNDQPLATTESIPRFKEVWHFTVWKLPSFSLGEVTERQEFQRTESVDIRESSVSTANVRSIAKMRNLRRLTVSACKSDSLDKLMIG